MRDSRSQKASANRPPKYLLSSKCFLAANESSSVYTLAGGGFNLIEPVKDGFCIVG